MTTIAKKHDVASIIGAVIIFCQVISQPRKEVAIALSLWAALPFLVSLMISRQIRSAPKATLVSLIGIIVVLLWSGWTYYMGFYAHPDAQSALLLFFMPAYGLVLYAGFAIPALIVYFLSKLRNKRSSMLINHEHEDSNRPTDMVD